jgi:NADPH-dependent F420 reductase
MALKTKQKVLRLAVIGSGNIGKSIGSWAAAAGYEVVFTARNPEHAKAAATEAGKESLSGSGKEAVQGADLVLLAIPYTAVKDFIAETGSQLNNKVLIDATNPLNSDYSGLSVGLTTSAAEEIQKLAPGALVVKAFNTVFADVFRAQNPVIRGNIVSVFIAGDDAEAKNKVSELVKKMGFDAVDTGPLKSARNLEPLALLNIGLGYGQGYGTMVGFSFLR